MRDVVGTGGMGTVYRAEVAAPVLGLEPGAVVAVKVVHPHLLQNAQCVKRFGLETDLGRTIEHANVVRTFGGGREPVDGVDQHFLVMELVQGQTLRDLLDELGRVPEELCRHVALEVARGLEAVHAAGVVHRDLKLENVLITADQVVKIMDLGVAQLMDEAIRLSQTGQFAGTIRAAAPEQFGPKGTRLDGRADLHALGAMLYELSTGEHPFDASDPHAVLRRVLSTAPRPVSELNPQLSPFFEEVVHALLQKAPDDRPASAGDVVSILEQAEDGPWWQARARSLREATQRPLRRVRIPRDTALYGREPDLALLDDLYAKVVEGRGQVLLLEGEAGVGKTRLVDEFVRRLEARQDPFHFLHGAYPPGQAPTIAGAWTTAYREHFGPENLDERLEGYLASPLRPAFAALLRGEPPPKAASPLTQESLHTAFLQTTQRLAQERPTILWIEDLHFAPPEAITLLAALSSAVREARVLILAATRPRQLDLTSLEFLQLSHVNRHALGRLGARDLVSLLTEAFHSASLAQELSGRIAVKSDGNPFFVLEIVRALREEGSIERQPNGAWKTTERFRDITVPSSMMDMVRARIDGLDREERELLEVAACLGFEFDPVLAVEAAGLDRIPGLKLLGRIERQHQLVRSAGRRVVFDHHQVQEWLYEGTMLPLREEYHFAIARALEPKDGRPVDGPSAEALCRHYMESGREADALPYVEAALEHLAESCLNERVIELAEHLLDTPGLATGSVRLGLLLSLGSSLGFLGRTAQQGRVLEEAVALAESLGDPSQLARALGASGWYHYLQGDYDAAEPQLLRGLELAVETGNRIEESYARSRLAGHWQRRGRLDDARREYERWRVLSRGIDDPMGEAAALCGLGILHHMQGRYEEAADHYRRYLAMAKKLGYIRHEGVAVGNLGTTLRYLGRYEEALVHLRRRIEIAKDRRDRRSEAVVKANLGGFLLMMGELGESRDLLESSLATLEEFGARREAGFALNGLGIHAETRGDPAEALRYLDRVLAIRRDLEDPSGIGATLVSIGRIHLQADRFDAARPCLEEAVPLGEQQDDPSIFVAARILLARLPDGPLEPALEAYERHEGRIGHTDRMACLLDLYRLTGERRYVEEAHRLLETLRENTPERYRKAMVENVPAYRDIRDAWLLGPHTE